MSRSFLFVMVFKFTWPEVYPSMSGLSPIQFLPICRCLPAREFLSGPNGKIFIGPNGKFTIVVRFWWAKPLVWTELSPGWSAVVWFHSDNRDQLLKSCVATKLRDRWWAIDPEYGLHVKTYARRTRLYFNIIWQSKYSSTITRDGLPGQCPARNCQP